MTRALVVTALAVTGMMLTMLTGKDDPSQGTAAEKAQLGFENDIAEGSMDSEVPQKPVQQKGQTRPKRIKKMYNEKTRRHYIAEPTKIYESRYPTIYTMFVGRKPPLVIQYPYIRKLMQMGLIYELHLWSVKTGAHTEEDTEFIKEMITNTTREFGAHRCKHMQGESGTSAEWLVPYEYYPKLLEEEEYSRHPVIVVKSDDDVVYIDVRNFAEFLDFRLDSAEGSQGPPGNDWFIVYANIVNNGVCAYYQYNHGAFSSDGMSEEDRAEGAKHEKLGEYPISKSNWGSAGYLWSTKSAWKFVHKRFFADPSRFHWRADPIKFRPPIDESKERGQGRLSITFLAFMLSDAPRVLKVVSDHNGKDELALTTIATRGFVFEGKREVMKECIYPNFNVAHLGFHKQLPTRNRIDLHEMYWQFAKKQPFLKGLI